MHRLLPILVTLFLLTGLPAASASSVHWEYEGIYGPQNWSDLSIDFGQCASGTQQSPIDLDGAVETYLPKIELHWTPSDLEIANDGRNLTFTPTDGGHAVIDGTVFSLLSFDLHNPSEHHVEGVSFPMEMQFLHQSQSGAFAILSILIRGGGVNAEFDALLARVPPRKNEKAIISDFDPRPFVTDLSDQWRYEGSFTEPPCAETVTWTVLTDPLAVSDAAILAFDALFGATSRPLQARNRRYILTD